MTALPDEVVSALSGRPEIGELDQAFLLLTAAPDGPIDVCLLSRTEVRATPESVLVAVASGKARRNLAAAGRATLVVVAGDAAWYLALELRRSEPSGSGLLGAELAVVRVLRDSVGVELEPLRFRVEERLRVDERWDRSADLLGRLAGGPGEGRGGAGGVPG